MIIYIILHIIMSDMKARRDISWKRQDLRRLSWARRAHASGTSGMFLKSREGTGQSEAFYKLSCYDSYRGVYGHECVNELVAARLMDALGIPHVDCRLINALIEIDGVEHETWLMKSHTFRRPGERKQALDLFYDLNKRPGESPLELCARHGWSEAIGKMMVADYLIANRDRHGANIEVLRGPDGTLRLAPLFDNGISLLFSCYGDVGRMRAVDPLEDFPANNYLGMRSLEGNLALIPEGVAVQPLEEGDGEVVMRGLDRVMPPEWAGLAWNMIWRRWCRYAGI